MRIVTTLIMAMALFLAERSAFAEDSTEIKPEIRALPEFATAHRYYCLLTLATEPTTAVWIIVDGDQLYFDRNANGDLTEPGERFAAGNQHTAKTEFTDPKLRRRFTDITIRWSPRPESPVLIVSTLVEKKYRMESIQDVDSLASKPQDAPIVALGAELELEFIDKPEFRFWTGNNARTILPISVVLQTESSTGHTATVLSDSLPEGIHPVVEVKYGSGKENEKPIVETVDVDSRNESYFSATATVPQSIPPGPVTLTARLKGWKAVSVKPATLKSTLPKFKDLPVVGPKQPDN